MNPQVRFAPRRAARMLGYAADTLRGTALTPVRGRHRGPHKIGLTALFCLLLYPLLPIGGLVAVALSIQNTVRAPGAGLNYMSLAWGLLLVAWPISGLARSAERTSALLCMGSCLAGVAFFLWNAARAPGDWANYFVAAFFFAACLTVWFFGRWAHIRRRKAARGEVWGL